MSRHRSEPPTVDRLGTEVLADRAERVAPGIELVAVLSPRSTAVRALKPGGWLLPGTFAGPDDRLSQLLLDLRTARSAGHPWTPERVIEMIADAGLTEASEVPRTWVAPVRLYAGRARS